MSFTRQPHHTMRQAIPVHLFAAGQTVRFKGGFLRPPLPSEIYRVIGTLPAQGDSLQYRIRNDEERHDRVTTQDNLELVGISQLNHASALIERIFGHGQGTKKK